MGGGNRWRKTKRRKKRKREREREGGEEGRSERLIPLIYWRFDGRSSLGRELKSIYSMRATLEEVWTLPTLSYLHHKGCLAGCYFYRAALC